MYVSNNIAVGPCIDINISICYQGWLLSKIYYLFFCGFVVFNLTNDSSIICAKILTQICNFDTLVKLIMLVMHM